MKKWVIYLSLGVLIPLIVVSGALLFDSRGYMWIALCVTVVAMLPFFLRFEQGRADTRYLVLIACMVALSVISRIAFNMVPHFKPVTALIILTGMYFGGEAGLLVGALSALISNFHFGQGAWTPFQMLAWGFVGLLAGVLADPLKRHRLLLMGYAALSGFLYSLIVDLQTVIFIDNAINLARYVTVVTLALPTTVTYMVSNVVFVLLLAYPIGKIFTRLKTKYGI